MSKIRNAAIAIVCFVGFVAAGLQLDFWVESGWKTVPTADGKWRSCLTEASWQGIGTGCGSPETYDEAEWWTRTKGGEKVKP